MCRKKGKGQTDLRIQKAIRYIFVYCSLELKQLIAEWIHLGNLTVEKKKGKHGVGNVLVLLNLHECDRQEATKQ